MALFVRMIIVAVNMTLHNNIFHSNSYIILICVMCLWPGLVVDTRYSWRRGAPKALGTLAQPPTMLYYS
jgi:hypothetical protein